MIHLMRDGSSQDTRERIVDAVAALVTEEHPATISVPAVARRAGLSVATVYRYFPNKEQLLDAATEVGHRRTSAAFAGRRLDPDTDASVDALVGALFGEFADNLDFVRQTHASGAGRDLRRRRRPGKALEFGDRLRELGIDPERPAAQRLAVLVELLVSSTAFLELHDHLGLDAGDAAAHVSWAVRTLVEASR
jgi:AcrR family transcriptional regulator